MAKTKRKSRRGINAGYRLIPLLNEERFEEFNAGFWALKSYQRMKLFIKLLSYIMPKMKPVPYAEE